MPEVPDQLAKAEKMRQSLAWLSGGAFWLVVATFIRHLLGRYFPNVETESRIIIEGIIGAPLSVFLGFLVYRLVLVKTIRDSE
jgi:hypothetical protein